MRYNNLWSLNITHNKGELNAFKNPSYKIMQILGRLTFGSGFFQKTMKFY